MKPPAGARILSFALAFCLPAIGARAASPPGVQWVADVTPDPSTSYPVNSVHRLGDGSVLVVGSQFFAGVAATHLAADGTVLSTHELPLPEIYDGSLRVAVDAFGAVFVGLTANPRPYEAWVMKFDGLTGRALWPGPFHYRPDAVTDTLFRALAVDARGNVFVTGLSATGTGVTFIYSLDGATGGILWGPVSHVDPATPGLTFLQVAADANGDAVVSGSWAAGALGQIAAFKFDGRTGAPLWGPVLVPAGSAGPDVVRFAALDLRGDLVIVGDRTEGQVVLRAIVVKIDGKTGSISWGPLVIAGIQTAFPPSNLLRLDALGDVLLGAWSPVLIGGATLGPPVLFKLSGQDGSVLWGPIPYPGDPSALPYPIAAVVEPNGDLVATFSERTSNPVTRRAVTARIDGATGALLWGPSALPSAGVTGALLLEPGGDLLLAVSKESPGFTFTVDVVFYSGATGATTRGPLSLPPSARSGRAVRVAVDAAGDVVTLGQVNRDGTFRTALIKYRGATGTILWGPVEVPSDAWGSPRDLKLAANGDPIWIGTGENPAFGTGGVVLSRFSGSTGAVVWGPRVFTQAYASALALDGNGDIFALGTTVLLKCDGLTGGLLWGPAATPNPGANSLRVGPNGDVVVAGWYSGAAVGQYRGTTGALVWGPITIAAASYPQAMEVDSRGDILLAGEGLVMKLHGVDGSSAWGPVTLVDLAGGFSSVAALALDSAGNAVAEIGTYDGATFRRAAVLAKYDNASGARIWGPVTWDAGESPEPEANELFLILDSAGDAVVAATGRNDAYPDLAVRKYSGVSGSAIWGPVTFDGPGANFLAGLALAGNDPVLAGSSMDSMRTVRFGFGLSLETQAWQIPPALCGQPYAFGFQIRNGTPPHAFSIVSGALPAGLVLDPASGALSGVTGPAGAYPFRLRVGNAAESVERDYTLVVVEGQPVVDIDASPAAVCEGNSAVLSVTGLYASYLWLPGGQTTANVTVSPAATTTYDFIGTTTNGCVQRGSRIVTVLPTTGAPFISAPPTLPALAGNVLAAVADHPGSKYAWSIGGGLILSGQGTHEIRFGAGVGGDLTLTVSETNGSGCSAPASTLSIAVTPATTRLFPVAPCRVYDSRVAGLALAPGEVRRLVLAGPCGLPATARAVAMNVTAVGLSGSGQLSVAPGGTVGASSIGPGWTNVQIRATSMIVGLDAASAVDVSCKGGAGTAHVVIDVAGYFE